MASFLDAIFTPLSLLAINAVIIVLTETVGGGELFFQKGIIHIIALLFIGAALARAFLQDNTRDPLVKMFIRACMVALAIFAGSHIFEFFTMIVLHSYKDATFAGVVNLYAASILAMALGAEAFLRAYHGKSLSWVTTATLLAIPLFLGLTATTVFNDSFISLEPDEAAPYVYAAVLSLLGIGALAQLCRVKKTAPLLFGFVRYLRIAVVCIVLAAWANGFYEVLLDRFGVPEHQAVYLSHFAFYAALSALFLAFQKLAHAGGGSSGK